MYDMDCIHQRFRLGMELMRGIEKGGGAPNTVTCWQVILGKGSLLLYN
jgi:hypothetical protein